MTCVHEKQSNVANKLKQCKKSIKHNFGNIYTNVFNKNVQKLKRCQKSKRDKNKNVGLAYKCFFQLRGPFTKYLTI